MMKQPIHLIKQIILYLLLQFDQTASYFFARNSSWKREEEIIPFEIETRRSSIMKQILLPLRTAVNGGKEDCES